MRGRSSFSERKKQELDLIRSSGPSGDGSGLANWAKEYGSPSERIFENLVESFRPRAKAIVGFHRIPPEDADDLVQQTYLTYLSRWREVRNPQAWLAGTLRKRCLMFWRARRQSWLSTVESSVLEARADRRVPQKQVRLRLDLARMARRLPERSRELLRLRYGWGCCPKETAERLGYRYSGIYTITKRCLEMLAAELEAAGWCDGEDRVLCESTTEEGRGGGGTGP